MKKKLVNYVTPVLIGLALAGCDFFPNNVFPDRNSRKEEIKLESLISPKTIEILDNYQQIKRKRVEKNDNYLNYARELQKEDDNLKKLRADEIYKYIKYRLNYGKELIAGDIINLPADYGDKD